MAAGFSGLLNGPQSAGEIRMLGATGEGGGLSLSGCLELLNGLLESGGGLEWGECPWGCLLDFVVGVVCVSTVTVYT